MKIYIKILSLVVISCFTAHEHSQAQVATTVVVRAKAKGAKFLGSSVGGAKVIIRNAGTGEILAKGITEGTTGSMDLMNKAFKSGERISGDGDAAFKAQLKIEEAVFATIEVYGPALFKDGQVMSSTQIWILPGVNIEGDGIVLEMPGLFVEIVSPGTHDFISLEKEKSVELTAHIVMMCGCTINDNGAWNQAEFEVAAEVYVDGLKQARLPLTYQKPNYFNVKVPITKSGNYEVRVYAYQKNINNTGYDVTRFSVR